MNVYHQSSVSLPKKTISPTKAGIETALEMTSTPLSSSSIRVGELYWKQEGEYGWILGQVVAMDVAQGTAKFCLIDETTGERLSEVESPPELIDYHVQSLYPANPLFSTAADMTSLIHLHEAALAKNLEDRSSLQNQRPYTFMANVLIAVNPLKYLEEPDKQLFIGQSLDRCPPHPYYIAENAYRQLCAVRAMMQNQSIIISGESGSGKTETSKIILNFLTTRAMAMSRTSSIASEEESMEPELTPTVHPPISSMGPPSTTMALSYPHSNNSLIQKLSPVALGGRLMETIPILESFGNAKTHRNHNSSRFGKYMRLQFSTTTHELSGASIDTYLLEKSRLVSQPTGERNFHVFYELLHSNKLSYLQETLHLQPNQPQLYHFLNQSGCFSAELMDDAENFQNLCRALEFVGIYDDARDEIFKIVAGLLHIGNIVISEEDTSEGKTGCIASTDEASQLALRYSAELLGVSVESLSECILLKRIVTRGSRRGSIYFAKRDVRNAIYARDTIAKTIYEHVFTWLMIQCASALDYDATRADVVPYIGVLDIFGFEDFEPKNRNSFEQLLINYANEALQSLFNACIFEAEQELYRSEHIYEPTNHSLLFPYPLPGSSAESLLRSPLSQCDVDLHSQTTLPSGEMVQYADNRECLNLIASRHGGIFVTIDNVSRLPAPSDRKLNERLHTLFKRHPCFPTPHPKDARDTFIVRHYAGSVTYSIHSFVDKNNNLISDHFEELIKKSTSRILQEITGRNRTVSQTEFSNQVAKTNAMGNFGPSSKRAKGGSASSLFSTQMKGLITELEGTACNFVRCIKPNTQMKPGIFDKPFVVEQLRCSGTVQACEVLRVGLPTRILYAEVVDVYKSLLPGDMFSKFEYNEKLFTQAILWVYDFPTSAYRLGDTRLFFRTGKIDLLDRLLSPSSSTADSVQLTQSVLLYLRKRRWIAFTTKIIAYNQFKTIYFKCKYRRKATIIQCMVRRRLAQKRVAKLRVQRRISAMWTRMAHKAEIMRSYQDLPEDKMVLLNKLLSRNYLPPGQRWLLKWLGPLQRVIYLQKLWKKVTAQYLAKQGFIWLYERVKRKRSVIRMQALARCIVAKKMFLRLKRARIARQRWQMAFLKVKVFALFRRELHRIHVIRLENDNSALVKSLAVAQEQIRAAEAETEQLRVALQEMQVKLDRKTVHIAEQGRQIDVLETSLEMAQEELVETKQRVSTGVVERMIRFFTCCTLSSSSPPASSPKSAPNEKSTASLRRHDSANKSPVLHRSSSQGRKLSSEYKDADEMTSPVDDDDDYGDEEEMKAKEAKVLYSVSRFCL